ncbi:hypothetical protein V1504DRAFT_436609 [Lipomyces starkeyi]
MGILVIPGTKSMIVRYLPIFREHIQDMALLKTIPATVIRWSILCPSYMIPRSTNLVVPSKGPATSNAGGLVA